MARSLATTRFLVNYNTPNQLQGLIAWYKADALTLSDGATVTSWTDSSNSGFNATNSGTPIFKTNIINSQPVVRFDGASGFQLGTTGNAESAFDVPNKTIFAVFKYVSGVTIIAKNTTGFVDARRRKMQLNVAGTTTLGYSDGADGSSISVTTPDLSAAFNVCCVVGRTDANHDFIINGTTTNNTGTLFDHQYNNTQVEIGQAFSNGAERFTGDIAEIIVYNRALSSNEALVISNYLSTKYGLSTSNIGTPPQRQIATGRQSI